MITGKTKSGLMFGVRQSGSAAAYCALSIRCGTRDEVSRDGNDFHRGIAHFAEHTIFKGTSRKSSAVINGYLDRLGGELNAYTTKEEIVIHATVLKEDVAKAASLLLELATMPIFPEDEIATEKGVVIDEINSCKDVPSEEIYDRFEQMLFEGHPLSGQILGTTASVKKITSEELRRFVREKFIPSNMALTIVSAVGEEKMKALVEKLDLKFFGSLDDEPRQLDSRWTPQVPLNVFDKTVSRRSHQVNCIIGGLAPSLYQEEERIAMVLLCNILGGPASNSVLNSILREKNGWVYGVECSYTQYAESGVVAICLGCEKENLDKCVRTIRRELLRIQDKVLSQRCLKAAKKQLLGQLAINSDNGEAQCLSMGKSLLSFGRIAPDGSNREKVEAVTAEQIQTLARKYFAPEKLSKLVFI